MNAPSNTTARIPPHNAEAEQTILGTMLISPRSVPSVMSSLSPLDFYRKSHSIIFASMEKVFKSSCGIDFVTICDDLKSSGKFDEAGGAQYLAELTNVIAATSNIKFHCDIVKNYSRSRSIIQAALVAVDSCYRGENSKDIFSDLGTALAGSSSEDKSNTDTAKNITSGIIKEIKGLCDGSINNIGIQTGFIDFDRITRGLQKTNLIIIAARPSMGKTTMVMNMVSHAAKHGNKVLIFSLEMSKKKLVQKQLSSLSGVLLDTIQNGTSLNDTTWPMLRNAASAVSKMNITLDDSSALDISQIQARAKMQAIQHGVDMVVVDYLGLAKCRSSQGREREVSDISAGLKALAKDLDIPVVALSQLSRKCEDRTDKRPLMSDLRDSGSIEQDADVVAFIYRDEVYNNASDNPLKGIAELLVRKNREGRTGEIKMVFDGATCKFSNYIN